ncbi:MAG TPA: hypothetical protein DDW55_15085 [Gammaproteobacteria bacterium]|nr:hypothetical protein [Gammaproteobacteria bacterium]
MADSHSGKWVTISSGTEISGMHKLVMTLGKSHGQHYHDHESYKTFLYELFPRGPVPELCKLAGLPKPMEEFED